MQATDKTTGKPIDIPDDQVQAAWASGLISLPAGAKIPVQRSDGQVGTVLAKDLDTELDAGGQVVSQDVYDKAALQAKYGGVGMTAAGVGEGIARGLTLGGSDIAATGVAGALGGPEAEQAVRQHLAGVKEANPIASTGGEVVGAVLPTLFSEGAAAPEEAGVLGLGEAGAAARVTEAPSLARGAYDAATFAPRQISEASNLIERGIGGIVGDNSPNILARAAQSAVAKGAQGAFEGAVYGMANQVDEDALGDHDTTAEKLFAAAGHGAVFGGVLGGGMGALGGATSAGIGKIARSPLGQRIAESEAWRAISPRKAFSKEAERIPGGWRSVGREMLDSGVIQKFDTVENIAPRLETLRSELGDKLGASFNALDQAGAKGVQVSDLLGAIKGNLPKAAIQLEKTAGTMGKINDIMDDITRLGGKDEVIKLSDLQSIRVNLDTIINWEKGNPSPALQALRSARGAVEDKLIETADTESKRLNLGQDWANEYKALKLKFRRIALADDAAQDSLVRMHANNESSLTDRIAGAAAGAAGLHSVLAAASHAHPMGLAASAARLALGPLAGQVSKQIRQRGNATVAAWLDHAADLAAVKQVTKRFDEKVALKAAKAAAGKVTNSLMHEPDTDEYEAHVSRVRAAHLSQDQAIERHLGSIQNNAPKVSGKFGNVARRATEYLYTRIPPERQPGIFGEEQEVPEADKLKFLKAERAISHPDVLLDDIMSGTLDQDTLDAVKTVYPHMYDEMKAELGKHLDDPNISYDRKLQISMFLGVDPDGTMNPALIQALQGNYSTEEKPKRNHHAGGGGGKPSKIKGVGKGMTLGSRAPTGWEDKALL